MSYARQLLDTYPGTFNVDAAVLADASDAVNDCAQACTSCADDSLAEQDITALVKVIRLDLDCADVCTATVRVLSRQTEYDANLTRSLLETCVTSCKSGRMRAARRDARALPSVRRGMPSLRTSLPAATRCHEVAAATVRREELVCRS